MPTINEVLTNKEFLGKTVSVQGEIVEITHPEVGPKLAFTIKDDTGQVRVVIWEDEETKQWLEIMKSAKPGDRVAVTGYAKPFKNVVNIQIGRAGGSVELLPEGATAPPRSEVIEIGEEKEERRGETALSQEEVEFVKWLYRQFKERFSQA